MLFVPVDADSLHVEELQVLVDFFQDANGFHWHHSLLLHALGEGRWTCSTPVVSVQLVGVEDHRVIIPQRNSPQDFLGRMRSAGYLGLSVYHANWLRNSGIRERSAVCREPRFLVGIL